MKHTTFIIEFITGKEETVYAFNIREAAILAQAEQIKEGNNCDIKHIYYFDEACIKQMIPIQVSKNIGW